MRVPRNLRRNIASLLSAAVLVSASAVYVVGSGSRDQASAQSQANITSQYLRVRNQFASIDGVLRHRSGEQASTVVITTHPRTASIFTTWPCEDLAERGVDTFCFTNRNTNHKAGEEIYLTFEEIALDVAAAVQQMRDLGYEHVVLHGGSAGAPTFAFYQNVAENGNSVFSNFRTTLSHFRGFFTNGGEELRLPPADGIIFRAPTPGTGVSFLYRLDASIANEANGNRIPPLDMFNPANGFDPEAGTGKYSDRFLRSYWTGQADRMNRLIESAQQRLAALEAGKGRFTDDDVMLIPAVSANPTTLDVSLAHTTTKPFTLLPSGKQQIITDVREPDNTNDLNRQVEDGSAVHSLRTFLSYRATRVGKTYNPFATTVQETGIDFESVNSTIPGNLDTVSVPILIVQGTADNSDSAKLPTAELIYNSAHSADKTLVFVEGAGHGLDPVDPKYGDTQAIAADGMVDWLANRFPL